MEQRVWRAAAMGLCVVVLACVAQAHEENGEEEEEWRHRVGVFVGGGIENEGDAVLGGGAIGLNYQLRLVRLLSLGIYGEATGGNIRDAVVLFPFVLHPWRGLEFVVGPGLQVDTDLSVVFAIRLGLGYKLPLGPFEVGPDFNVDVVEGRPIYIFGVGGSFGF